MPDPGWESLELDGLLGHEGEEFRDMNRDNLHVLCNEATLRYGYSDVGGRPCPAGAVVEPRQRYRPPESWAVRLGGASRGAWMGLAGARACEGGWLRRGLLRPDEPAT